MKKESMEKWKKKKKNIIMKSNYEIWIKLI